MSQEACKDTALSEPFDPILLPRALCLLDPVHAKFYEWPKILSVCLDRDQ